MSKGQARIEQILGLVASLLGKKVLNGMVNRTDSTMSMNGTNFEIAPAVSSYSFFSNGVEYTKTGTDSVAILYDNALHFVYFDSSGVLQVSLVPWDVTSDNVLVAVVFRKDASNFRIGEERHGAERNRLYHQWAHSTIGTRYDQVSGGLGGSFTNTTFQIESGAVFDEDIKNSIGTETTGIVWWRATTGSSLYMDFDPTPSTAPYPLLGGLLAYDNAGVLTAVPLNRYANYYIYGGNDINDPIYILTGQGQHSNIENARNEAFPQILLPTAEWKLLYRVTYQRTGGGPVFIEAADYRQVSTGPAVDAAGLSHNDLLGRNLANSHPTNAISHPTYLDGGATYDSLKDLLDITQSAGLVTGGVVTDNGDGTVDVSGGTALIKTTDSDIGENVFIDFPARAGLALTDQTLNFIYLDYDSDPHIILGPPSHTGQKRFLLTTAFRWSTPTEKIWTNDVSQDITNTTSKLIARLTELDGARRHTGLSVVEDASVDRALNVSAGTGYTGLKRWSTPSFDTSVSPDVFDVWYDTSGGWERTENNTLVDNTFYNDPTTSGGLISLGNNKFSCRFVFVVPDNEDTLHVIYGQNEYNSLAEARTEQLPSDLPYLFTYMGVACARVIVQQGASGIIEIGSAFEGTLGHTATAIHNFLGGLQGGTSDEYYHLTQAQHDKAVNGPIVTRVTSTPYDVTSTDDVLFIDTDSIGEDATVNLPSGTSRRHIAVYNAGTSGYDVTIVAQSPDTIEGTASLDLADGEGFDGHFNTDEGWYGVFSGSSGPATQIIETSGPTTLDIGDILDGQHIKRSGTSIIGVDHLETKCLMIAVGDDTDDLSVGATQLTFRMPFAFTLTGVRASVATAPTGSLISVDINKDGSSVLTSNKLTIDAGEKTSVTAATPVGINVSALGDDDEITIDIDQVGSSTPGKGLKISLLGTIAAEDVDAIVLAVGDETSDLTVGTGKLTFRAPFSCTLTDVRANVRVAPIGAVLTVDINKNGTTILSTKLTVDAGEKTSETAATPVVISDTAISSDDEITIDIDQVGSTIPGQGLKIAMIGQK